MLVLQCEACNGVGPPFHEELMTSVRWPWRSCVHTNASQYFSEARSGQEIFLHEGRIGIVIEAFATADTELAQVEIVFLEVVGVLA